MNLDEHDLDEEGEHWEDECQLCIERNDSVSCNCRCGHCCESLLIEVSLRDAEREPEIARKGSPIYDDNFGQGPRELIGYLLYDTQKRSCPFFNKETRLCTIWETRPLVCRVFNCDIEREERWPDAI